MNSQSHKEIPLTHGKIAIVDAADYEYLNQWKWGATRPYRVWYAVRYIGKKGRGGFPLRMHREILSVSSPAQTIDHVNGDGLDNRRCNLRLASTRQNCYNVGARKDNKSGQKGVTWHKASRKWRAQIAVPGKIKHLGTFAEKAEAIKAYQLAAREVHGEFAKL